MSNYHNHLRTTRSQNVNSGRLECWWASQGIPSDNTTPEIVWVWKFLGSPCHCVSALGFRSVFSTEDMPSSFRQRPTGYFGGCFPLIFLSCSSFANSLWWHLTVFYFSPHRHAACYLWHPLQSEFLATSSTSFSFSHITNSEGLHCPRPPDATTQDLRFHVRLPGLSSDHWEMNRFTTTQSSISNTEVSMIIKKTSKITSSYFYWKVVLLPSCSGSVFIVVNSAFREKRPNLWNTPDIFWPNRDLGYISSA